MDAPGCTMTLAKLFSRKAVIADLKAAGIKPSTLSYADVSAQALAYCEAHREAMIAKALWAISRSPCFSGSVSKTEGGGYGKKGHQIGAPQMPI